MRFPSDVRASIQARLDGVESEHDVVLVFAAESGSRAWGFESADSDWDVRFLYLHRPNWYASIDLETKRDVIELPIEDDLDINGWDLRKALRLLRASNPPLLEWLSSPIVYRERSSTVAAMRELARTHHSPRSCTHHYLRMARRTWRENFDGALVRRKKYLYVLRPLLAVLWIERALGLVPTEFHVMVERLVTEPALKHALGELLELKRRGSELDRGPRIERIDAFIERELPRLEASAFNTPHVPTPIEPFDQLFRDTLREAWTTGS